MGFVGSCLTSYFNQKGREDIVLVDDFSKDYKKRNIEHLKYLELVFRDQFFAWVKGQENQVEYIYHLGARTDTTEFDESIFDELNLNYSKSIWMLASEHNIPLIYASSAATYGDGELGYKDGMEIEGLKPLNPYGWSKQNFDLWVKEQVTFPPFWAGLKFFNVYGPNEYHKARMASVVFHAFNQIKEEGSMKLFRSHRADYSDGGQLRDFIYVKDLISIIDFISSNDVPSDIYNVGTGKAQTFKDLAKAVFKAIGVPENIQFIDTPEDIRDKYQYYTKADMNKLISLGYDRSFFNLEEGAKDYVLNYLESSSYY